MKSRMKPSLKATNPTESDNSVKIRLGPVKNGSVL